MRIGFIGAGRVGFSLGKYLKEVGLNIIGYYSSNINDSLEASRFVDCEYYSNINELVNNCDTLFLTVNDDSLELVIKNLLNLNIKNKILIHTSGSYSSLLFEKLNIDNYCYSLHPIYAFNDKFESYKGLNDCYFTVDGNEKYINDISNLFKIKTIIIDKNNKDYYHANMVMASNLINGLIMQVFDNLSSIGIKNPEIIIPLFINNSLNIKKYGPLKALTGPISRNDINTVKKHLYALDPYSKKIYILLSMKLCEMTDNKNEIYEILKEFL